jgi:hypothetical protein
MSAGHGHKTDLTPQEMDDLLDEALANPKVKARLARPFRLITTTDVPLVGSSGVGGWNVYFDRNLRVRNHPYGLLLVKGKWLDVKPGLVRHERGEQTFEDVLGWPYLPFAHFVAQHWEERDYKVKGFNPEDVEAVFQPLIKRDAHERITKVATDLDMRPLMFPPRDSGIIAHVKKTANKEKRSHESVGYVDNSPFSRKRCHLCKMFIREIYGGPACVGVVDDIKPSGWCRRFKAGSLEDGGG